MTTECTEYTELDGVIDLVTTGTRDMKEIYG